MRRGFAVTIKDGFDEPAKQIESSGSGTFIVVEEVRRLVREGQTLLIFRETAVNKDESVSPLRNDATAKRSVGRRPKIARTSPR
jgi:hypothetical protein